MSIIIIFSISCSRRKSSADVLYDPVLPIYTHRTMDYPTYIPAIIPPAYSAVEQKRRLSCTNPQYANYQENLRHSYRRRRSMPFDNNPQPPVYIPPSNDDADDVFVCEPPQSMTHQRRKRIHSIENLSEQDDDVCQDNKKLKEAHSALLSLSQRKLQQPSIKKGKTISKYQHRKLLNLLFLDVLCSPKVKAQIEVYLTYYIRVYRWR